jgi:hypothetical protein
VALERWSGQAIRQLVKTMTFEDFQELCAQAVSTGQSVTSPCPIIVGSEEAAQSMLGDTPFHHIVIFKMKPDDAALQAIYATVRFSFDEAGNQTVIQPITTGA